MFLITNRHLCSKERYLDVLKEASYSGIDYIVLREKDLSNEELEKLYYKVKQVINKSSKIIINNNVDVYKSVGADGIHLSFEKFLKFINENKFIDNKLIGVSTHSIKEIQVLYKYKINYVFLSHIYETKCKEGLNPIGIDMLEKAHDILKTSNIKLIALGGITPSNCKNTLKYCDDIAVMSTIMKSNNVKNTMNEYKKY